MSIIFDVPSYSATLERLLKKGDTTQAAGVLSLISSVHKIEEIEEMMLPIENGEYRVWILQNLMDRVIKKNKFLEDVEEGRKFSNLLSWAKREGSLEIRLEGEIVGTLRVEK